jgi:hypothetical protein
MGWVEGGGRVWEEAWHGGNVGCWVQGMGYVVSEG